jgi:hypothetical protein
MENKIHDSEFKIKFDGEHHQIDVNVLINNLIHTSTIIQAINAQSDSDKKIEIKIKALEKGSFLVHVDLIETTLDSLKNIFTKENTEYAATIIGGFAGTIEIYKFLKGKKEKSKTIEGNNVKIENENGDVIYVENFINILYETPIIKEALTQSFSELENDQSITGYEITDKEEKPLIRVAREEFEYLSVKSEEILNDEKIITKSAKLNIVRVSFDDKLSWEFYFKGNKITAKIDDPDFQKRIDKGEAFAKGDILDVELSIKQKFDTSVNTFINKSYKIKKIINHIKRNENLKIDFEE